MRNWLLASLTIVLGFSLQAAEMTAETAEIVLAEGATLTIDTSVFSGEDGELTFPAGFTPPPGKTAADVADFVKLSNPFGYEYEASSDLGRFTVRSRGAISFVAETQAAAWSQIADEEWSPMPFQPDSKNLVEVRAAGEAFAFDTAFISDTLRFACNRAEGCSVSFGKTPAVNALTIDGARDGDERSPRHFAGPTLRRHGAQRLPAGFGGLQGHRHPRRHDHAQRRQRDGPHREHPVYDQCAGRTPAEQVRCVHLYGLHGWISPVLQRLRRQGRDGYPFHPGS